MKMNWFDWLTWILVIIGAINWGLVGLFSFNLVGAIFGGDMSSASRVIYSLVGLAGIYLLIKMLLGASEE
jgi:uncharacterized membrane protein YuzA (DUF378 family)